jgi:hypothetical protein
VAADVPTVGLPIRNIFPQALATVEVFRIRVILETRDLERRIGFIVVSTQIPHQTVKTLASCNILQAQSKHAIGEFKSGAIQNYLTRQRKSYLVKYLVDHMDAGHRRH